ncbi:L-lysine 6-transaminase [Candidatus Fermentibacterales bacterium]|nr:L-lysine 6-transaminase [Candidatus Fermentibacterales bacterium]
MKRIEPGKVRETIAARMLADGFDIVLDLEKSGGGYIHDSSTGRDFLDLFSFFASAPLGMNHPRLLEPDFLEHLARVAVNKPSNSDFYTSEMATFVDCFASTLIPDSYPYLFFISGGALAVENALKAAFDWKVRKNIAAGRGEIGSRVIHFRNAFHGRTGYTLSLTNTADPRKYMYFPRFDWPRIDCPAARFPIRDHLETTEAAEKAALGQIDEAIARHGHDIACIVIEPIQGEGGDNHFRPEFLRELRRRADESELMLIYDEIQTGMGLTGPWWAWQALEVPPDIFCFGKKTQVCGIACSSRIDEVPENVFHVSSRLNSTWGGNLVDMVRCTRYLEIMQEEDTLQNVSARSEQLMRGLHGLAASFDAIGNVRGRGLMCAFDLPSAEARDRTLKAAFSEGAILLPCGCSSIRFRPPLNISGREIDRALEILRAALSKTS